MDLQTILLQQTAAVPGENRYLAKVRTLITCLEEFQLRLGLRFRTPVSASVSLGALFEQCQSRVRMGSADKNVVWACDGPDCLLHADAQSVSVMIGEIADAFFALGGGSITALESGGNACFQMQRHVNPASSDPQREMDATVMDEITFLVAGYGGTLSCEASLHKLTVKFPLIQAGPMRTTE